jgi:hypothetical protein
VDYLADHQHMLKLAASDELPREINEDGPLSVAVCRELYEAGLIDAADARTFDGDCFLQPRITIRGREYLNALEARAADASPSGRAKRFGS